jgi:hypothetical protein
MGVNRSHNMLDDLRGELPFDPLTARVRIDPEVLVGQRRRQTLTGQRTSLGHRRRPLRVRRSGSARHRDLPRNRSQRARHRHWRALPQDPARIPILVGEVLQHLRSALDHLVGELERKNGLQRTSEFEFPIFWDRARYTKDSPRKIKGVTPAVAAVIERHQPYHRPAPTYKDHPLWILHDLNNADKHRVLIGTGSSLTVDNLVIAIAPGGVREVVLAVSPRFRAVPTDAPGTVNAERWTLNATFTMFGQRHNQPIIPGLLHAGSGDRSGLNQSVIFDCRLSFFFRLTRRSIIESTIIRSTIYLSNCRASSISDRLGSARRQTSRNSRAVRALSAASPATAAADARPNSDAARRGVRSSARWNCAMAPRASPSPSRSSP